GRRALGGRGAAAQQPAQRRLLPAARPPALVPPRAARLAGAERPRGNQRLAAVAAGGHGGRRGAGRADSTTADQPAVLGAAVFRAGVRLMDWLILTSVLLPLALAGVYFLPAMQRHLPRALPLAPLPGLVLASLGGEGGVTISWLMEGAQWGI